MAITRVNSASSISATGTTGSAFTTTLSVAAAVGDLIVVTMTCNGTHVTNGMAFSDAVNGAYTTIREQQMSSASSRWMQTFYKVVTATTASTTTLTATPYASNTSGAFVVDIFRGTGGTISQAATGVSPTAGTSFSSPALGAAPAAGDLVLSLATAAAGTLTKPAAFALGSNLATGPSAENGWVSADGSSTYGGTWTLSASNSCAAETVAFSGSAAAPSPAARRLSDRRYAPMRSAVY